MIPGITNSLEMLRGGLTTDTGGEAHGPGLPVEKLSSQRAFSFSTVSICGLTTSWA